MIIRKNIKVFLIVFLVILLVTIGVVYIYKNSQNNSMGSQVIIESVPKTIGDSPTEIIEPEDKSTTGALMQDTYENNKLTYVYKSRQKNGVEITYPEISGLNSDSIKNSINSQISDRIDRILDSNTFRTNSDDSAYVNATITSNFSDVLSVKIFVKFTDSFSKNYGVNFRLDNGNRIKIDDLFTSNAPKKNIITSSAYKSFIVNYYTEDGISNDFYTNIDSDIVNFLSEYNSGKVTEFSFTPQVIELYRDGKTVKIDMQQYHQYMTIYSKFDTNEDLYKDDYNNGKDIPVFVQRPECVYDLFEKPNSTCYIDVVLYDKNGQYDFSEGEMKIIREYRNSLYSRLNGIRETSNVYYSNYVSIERKIENNVEILVFEEEEKFAAVEDNFNDRIYNQILVEQRDVNADNTSESKIYVLDDDMIASASMERKFDIQTGNEIVERQEGEDNQDSENGNGSNNSTENTNQVTNSTSNEVNNSGNSVENTQGNSVNNSGGDIDARVTF